MVTQGVGVDCRCRPMCRGVICWASAHDNAKCGDLRAYLHHKVCICMVLADSLSNALLNKRAGERQLQSEPTLSITYKLRKSDRFARTPTR